MVRNLYPKGVSMGAEERIRNGDLNGATVDQDNWVPIFETQSTRTLKYAPGHGVSDRRGNAGFADLDLQTSTPSDIDGQLRWEVYNDANKDDLVGVSATFRSENLRAAVNDNRTEKPMMPLLAPGAPDEGFVVLAFKADSGSDGDTISPSDSNVDVGLPYTRFQT
jgi:hypothetical protein